MTKKPKPAAPEPLSPVTSDEDLATFLRGFEIEAGGALIVAMRDGTTTPAQRAAIANRVIDITHGRPGQARQLTSSDLARMSEEERNELQVALLKLYGDNGLPPVLEQLLVEMLRLLTGQPEEPLPPAVPRWGDERDEQPGGVLYERRLRRDRLARELRARYGLDAPEPSRPRLTRGSPVTGTDDTATAIDTSAPAEAVQHREAPDPCTDTPDAKSGPDAPPDAPVAVPAEPEPRRFMAGRWAGNAPPRDLVSEVLPVNHMATAVQMSRMSPQQLNDHYRAQALGVEIANSPVDWRSHKGR
jgi:hypothetical protein